VQFDTAHALVSRYIPRMAMTERNAPPFDDRDEAAVKTRINELFAAAELLCPSEDGDDARLVEIEAELGRLLDAELLRIQQRGDRRSTLRP
jgi:hypothetical protein